MQSDIPTHIKRRDTYTNRIKKPALKAGYLFLGILFLSILSLPSALVADLPITIHVPDDYASIQQAIDAASDGDTIYLEPGVYYGTAHTLGVPYRDETITGRAFIIDNKAIILKGENKNTTILKSPIVIKNNSSAVIKNLNIFPGGDTAYVDFDGNGDYDIGFKGGVLVVSSSPTIENNIIHPDENLIHERGEENTIAVLVSGIELQNPFGSTAQYPTIRNNLIKDFYNGVYIFCQAFAEGYLGRIENNTFFHNNIGIQYRTRMEKPVIANNIFTDMLDTGIFITYKYDNLFEQRAELITYNLFYNNLHHAWLAEADLRNRNPQEFALAADQNNLFALNPLFENPLNGDFHLQWNSPCIDAGDPVSDYSNELEPNGGRINIGAFGNTAEAAPSSYEVFSEDFLGIGEYGIIRDLDHNCRAIKFLNTYPGPVVVIAKPISTNNTEPAHARIKGVFPSGFRIAVEEWMYLDGAHAAEQVAFLVIPAGRYNIDNGSLIIEAGLIPELDHSWLDVDFTQTFPEIPILFTQSQSYHGADPVITRNSLVDHDGFSLKLQEEEIGGDHVSEKVGYVAVTPHSENINLGNFDLRIDIDYLQVDHNWLPIIFSQDFKNSPVFLADMQTANGGNVAALRYRNLNNESVEVFLEEETSKDVEIEHLYESVGYFAFELLRDLHGPDIISFNIMQEATNVLAVDVSGRVDITDGDFQKILLTGNIDSPVEITQTNSDGTFSKDNVQLTTGDGTKTITATAYDTLDNPGNSFFEEVELDTHGPNILSLEANPAKTNSTSIISGTVQTLSDLGHVTLTGPFENPPIIILEAEIISGSFLKEVTLTSSGNITATAYDNLGNEGVSKSTPVTLDTQGPNIFAFDITEDRTNSLTVNVTGQVGMTTGDTDHVTLTGGIEQTVEIIPQPDGTFTGQATLTSGDGIKTITVTGFDDIGNNGNSLSDTVELDTIGPNILAFDIIQEKTNSLTVNVTGQVDMTTGDTDHVTLTGGIEQTVEIIPQPDGTFTGQATLTTGDGTKTMTATGYDDLDNLGTPMPATVELDTIGPDMLLLSANVSGTIDTTSILVSGRVSMAAADTGHVTLTGDIVEEIIVTRQDINTQGYFNDVAVSLTSILGPKIITATGYDDFGNDGGITKSITDIILDIPPTPTGLTAVFNEDSETIDMTWDPVDVPNLAGYKIYYGISAGDYTDSIDVNDATATSYQLSISQLILATNSGFQAGAAGKQTGRGHKLFAGQDTEVKFAADEIIVKFKAETVKLPQGVHKALISVISVHSPNIEKLNAKFGVVRMEKVFKNASGAATGVNLKLATQSIHNRFPKRAQRAPKNTLIPDLSNIYKLKLSKGANISSIIEEYKRDPDVEYAEPNYVFKAFASQLPKGYIAMTAYNDVGGESIKSDEVNEPIPPNDPYYSSSGSWGQPYRDMRGLHRIEGFKGWKIETGSSDIIVAVIDSGLDYNHPDIDDNVWINPGEDLNSNGVVDAGDFNEVDDDGNGFVDDIRGWDFVNDDNDPMDGHGHGTHVSGIIAAEGNNEIGIIGVAWSSRIMPVKGLNDSRAVGNSDELANALYYATDNGAEVINNSWGSSSFSALIRDAMAYAHSAGCVVVAATGNSGSVLEHYPAAYDNVIAVGASEDYDEKAGFSNYGAWVDIIAPGVDILSLRADGTDMYGGGSRIVDDNYYRSDGTSMASPFVAGLSALLLSRDPGFTNEDVANIIRMSADDIGIEGWDFETAYGRINNYSACSMDSPPDLYANIITPTYETALKENPISIQGSAYGNDFSYYKLEYAERAFSEDWTEISSSTTEIIDAELELWDIDSLSDGVFVIKLTVYGNDGFSKKVYIRRVLIARSEEAGWPVKIPGRITSSPSVADVDQDGKLDMAIGAIGTDVNEGLYYLLDHNGAFKQGWPTRINAWNDNSPLLADLDNDGYYEVITLSSEVETFVWDYLGNLLDGWPKDSIGSTIGFSNGFAFFRMQPPVIYDINGDGYDEILSRDVGDTLYIYDRQGNIIDGWPAAVAGGGGWVDGWRSVPSILPDKLSGTCAIFMPLQINTWTGDDYESSSKIYGFHNDGSMLEGWPFDLPMERISDVSSAVCNMDDDEEKEMVFAITGYTDIGGDRNYKFFLGALNKDGSFVDGWPIIIEDERRLCHGLAVADFNLNSSSNLIITYYAYRGGQYSAVVHVYNSDGTTFAGWPKEFTNSKYISYPTVGDINGDGLSEILVCVADRQDSNGIPYAQAAIEGGPTGKDFEMFAIHENEKLDGRQYRSYSSTSESAPYYTGKLYALKSDGTILDGWPISTGFAVGAPALCDIDADGKTEVILAGYNGWIHAWELGDYDSTTMEWPMYRHDPRHTGLYTDMKEPGPPVITNPANGTITNNPTPAIGGTAEPNSTVEIFDGGSSLGTTVALPDGTFSFIPPDPLADGEHILTATATDQEGNASDLSGPVTITIDAQGPANVFISIDEGDYTRFTAINLTLSATGADYLFIDGDVQNAANVRQWIPYATEAVVTLTAGDGVKTVSAIYKDEVGNESTTVIDAIALDTEGPTGTIMINSGDDLTEVPEVTLTLSAADLFSGMGEGAEMQFSNDDIIYSPPDTYITEKLWRLSDGNGEKTVYVKFKDAIGNWSDPFTDTIILDIPPPEEKAFRFIFSQMNKYIQGNTPRLVESYTDPYPPSLLDVHTGREDLYKIAFLYDNALTAIALTLEGTETPGVFDEHTLRAKQILEAFVWHYNHDPMGTKRLRDVYYADQDISTSTVSLVSEEYGFASTGLGNLSWTALALLKYYNDATDTDQITKDIFLETATEICDFIHAELYDSMRVGYFAHIDRYNNIAPYKSSEQNVDTYAAFAQLFAVTGESKWSHRANYARAYVEDACWNDVEKRYASGSDANNNPNQYNLVEDINAYSVLAFGPLPERYLAVDWVYNHLQYDDGGFIGFDFGINIDPGSGWYSPDPDGIWYEGTASMACAFQVRGAYGLDDYSPTLLDTLADAQINALNTDGNSIVAASKDDLTTGFSFFSYFASGHIAATSWAAFAFKEYNPFWNISTSTTVPVVAPDATGPDMLSFDITQSDTNAVVVDITGQVDVTDDDIKRVTLTGNIQSPVDITAINADGTFTGQAILTVGDGVKTITATAYDDLENQGAITLSDQVTFDTIAPLITIDKQPVEDPTNLDVNLNSSATDNLTPSGQIIITGDDSPYTVEGTYNTVITATDKAGNITTLNVPEFTIDKTAPIGTITINGGAASTNQRDVTLNLGATDALTSVTRMQITVEGDELPEEDYVNVKVVNIPGADGDKTVSVKYKDQAGNWSAPASDTILLDVSAPMADAINKRGIVFGAWWHDQYSSAEAKQALDNLAETGANYVGILATWHMDATDGTEYSASNVIYSHPVKSPTDDSLRDIIRHAKSRDMAVMLKLHIRVILSDDPFGNWNDKWAGNINPSDTNAWFESYKAFVNNYATLCEEEGVELYVFGTELPSMTDATYAAKWDEVINGIKAAYTGPITFSSNIPNEYKDITFWDRCDYLGIGPYLSLTAPGNSDPSLDEIIDGWSEYNDAGTIRNWIEDLEAWYATYNKPIIFTEMGYCSVNGSTYNPWKGTGGGTTNLDLQKRAYDALYLVFSQKTWFDGLFWWIWVTDPDAELGDVAEKEYTPQDKPAQESIENFYLGIWNSDIDNVKISDSQGDEIGDITLYLGSHKNFYLRAYDISTDLLGFVPVYWYLSNNFIGPLEIVSGAWTRLKVENESTTVLNAIHASGKNDITGTITALQHYLYVPSQYATIPDAIAAAAAGDIILVAPGTYPGDILIDKDNIGIVSESGPDVTIIDGGTYCVLINVASGSVLDGFTLRNATASGMRCIDSNDIIIRNNIIQDSASRGIQLISSTAIKIENNIIRNNSGGGISTSTGTLEVLNNTIVNNTANEGGGIYIANVPVIIKNNIIANNTANFGGGIRGWQAALTIEYNDAWNNSPQDYWYNNSPTPLPPTNILEDPRFVDANNNDYHLELGRSPCIDAGYFASPYTNEPAPNGARINQGAYGNTAEASITDALPIAFIDTISPNPVQLGADVTLTGHGTDSDGTVIEYSWSSDIDGDLGTVSPLVISTLTEGTHTISFKAKDNYNVWSDVVTDALVVDGTPPQNCAIVINGGAEYTNNTNATLTLSAIGAVQMFIDGDVLDAANVRQWMPYVTETAVVLGAGDGEKTLSVVYKDEVDNVSAPVLDSVILDIDAPQIIGITPSDGSLFDIGDIISFNINATDLHSPDIFYKIEANGVTIKDWNIDPNYDWDTASEESGLYIISVYVKDLFGNERSQNIEIYLVIGTLDLPPLP